MMRVLDLFCGAGGAAMGYSRAGFEVVGVDKTWQSNYPFEFIQGDALHVGRVMAMGTVNTFFPQLTGFDAIHASPPCQAFTEAQKLQGNEHPDLITPLRPLLEDSGLPYVIENVPGAPLRDPVELCGAMFPGVYTYRHRLFETNWPLLQPPHPPHPYPQTKMGRPRRDGEWMHVVGNFSGVDEGRSAMGADWMTRGELSEAIPPAYTEYIGRQLYALLARERRAA